MERFRVGTEIRRTRVEGFENRKRSAKVFSKIDETKMSTGKTYAAVMVIPTVGCSWALSASGGCSMCGYINDSTLDPETDPELYFLAEWEKLQQDPLFDKVEAVKLYNSGSFLDPKEISVESQKRIVSKIAESPQIKELVIECLPGILNAQVEVLAELVKIFGGRPIYVGVGLESSNAYILRSYVNKPFTYENQFVKCVLNAEKVGAAVKPYVLLKPPFLTEQEAIDDAVQSVLDSFAAGCKVVSLNPVCIHADTLVDQMFKRREYSPPWLWSVLEVLRKVHPHIPDGAALLCEVMAGGLKRGPHNCGVCDKRVLQEIEYYNLRGKFSPVVDDLACDCRPRWRQVLTMEALLAQQSSISGRDIDVSSTQPIH